jgi:hypothetical protein
MGSDDARSVATCELHCEFASPLDSATSEFVTAAGEENVKHTGADQ